ncbi:transcription factor, STE-like protein, partial [Neoconidiobolus thromboides FSU 785]
GSSISCIQWEGEHYITGMDIIRSLNYKLSLLGRQIINQKKLEEGIFSDLRNLKPNLDCKLELSHSNFLRFLHKNHCIRTMKKQKVFYFHAVPHDRMLNDILDRDIKRSALGLPTTTLL